MTQDILRQQRDVWANKPVLQAIYADYYKRIAGVCMPGLTLEIGGGSGNLKAYARDVLSTDLVPTPWLDAAADAQALPFRSQTFANIVAVDVLHHIERPRRFLAEAQRLLTPGGRLILLEPAITPGSWLFYKILHPEPVDMSADPLLDGPLDPGRLPFDANQGIPMLLFGRYRKRFEETFPNLKIVKREYLSLIAYPLSGGFRRWSIIPISCVELLLRIEAKVAPTVGRLLAFRMFVVIERMPFGRT
jgi:SAM-dependent methyltransferase